MTSYSGFFLYFSFMKIRLRNLQLDDIKILTRQFNNKKIWDNISDSIPNPYTEADAEYFIKTSLKKEELFNFAILCDEKFSGIIGLKMQDDVHRKSVELGYWVGEEYWGRGIATQATGLITAWAFKHLMINRIFARIFQHNKASMRVLEKNAYVKEGVLKKAIYKNAQFLDEYIYARLKK